MKFSHGMDSFPEGSYHGVRECTWFLNGFPFFLFLKKHVLYRTPVWEEKLKEGRQVRLFKKRKDNLTIKRAYITIIVSYYYYWWLNIYDRKRNGI